jgi:hypothetical protein
MSKDDPITKQICLMKDTLPSEISQKYKTEEYLTTVLIHRNDTWSLVLSSGAEYFHCMSWLIDKLSSQVLAGNTLNEYIILNMCFMNNFFELILKSII